ncbi:PfkB family carbohydrate kinase [Segetibacter sp.]|jgi:rfaE bifunctional protein kinase chain/domain|uniref:bifunctional heptose 7-phosphate kinase/heptose 1-phosphate adenyltransferase n=1 Tax=Segetibacter sp. TaxID=2231182 RepID=UPI00260B8158|nr:PfkB family carbohydrate kinase [Segetibacter sp.]MCW3079868.1 carbohydrate kinase [Segetibacter sp.]
MPDLEQLFSAFSSMKAVIVGDVMLDTYWWGNVERISPEAPVPVVVLDQKELRMGGAGNVALNTASLGASTTVFSVIGNDDDGRSLVNLLEKNNINCNQIVISNDRITTNKTRVISRNQHMLRLDAEMTRDINKDEEAVLIKKFTDFVEAENPSVVIFEDYNKGVLTASGIEQMMTVCLKNNIVTTVDPKRKNFFSFKNATIFKPNLKEVKDGLNVLLDDVNEAFLNDIHLQLKNVLQHSISLITLSEKGVFFKDDHTSKIIPTHIRSIADVSGAGDTVIAVASLVYAATKDIAFAAAMANIAGGLVCEEVGTVAINRQKLFNECCDLLFK